MAIDSSIAMGYQPIKLENPMNQLTQLMQIRAAQSQYDVGQQGIQEANKLNLLYSGAIDADGNIDRKKLLSGAAQQGLGSRIPGLQKGFYEADEAKGKADKQKVDLIDSKLKQSRQLLDGITTPEQFIAWHEGNHSDPVLGPVLSSRGVTADQSRATIMKAIQTPGGFEELLKKSALGLEKFTELNKPTYQTSSSGQVDTTYAIPGLGGAPTPVITTQKVATPGDLLTDERSRSEGRLNRGNALTIASQGVTYQQDGEGNFVALPSKVTPGQAIKGIPVTGPDGKPIKGANKDKPMTDAQSKAALFGSRMQAANEVLDSLATAGTTTSVPGARAGFGVGAVLNTVSSAKQQQLNQAKRDFVNAVLRRESGAVISDGEFDNAEKQYFPQVGDSTEVIAQKKTNREIAMRGVQAEVPKGQRGVINEIIGGNPIDSLLDKYK